MTSLNFLWKQVDDLEFEIHCALEDGVTVSKEMKSNLKKAQNALDKWHKQNPDYSNRIKNNLKDFRENGNSFAAI